MFDSVLLDTLGSHDSEQGKCKYTFFFDAFPNTCIVNDKFLFSFQTKFLLFIALITPLYNNKSASTSGENLVLDLLPKSAQMIVTSFSISFHVWYPCLSFQNKYIF